MSYDAVAACYLCDRHPAAAAAATAAAAVAGRIAAAARVLRARTFARRMRGARLWLASGIGWSSLSMEWASSVVDEESLERESDEW